jgi:hypothetical protein
VSGRRRGSSGWKDAQAEFGEAQPVIAGMELKAHTRRSHILAGAADDSLRQPKLAVARIFMPPE